MKRHIAYDTGRMPPPVGGCSRDSVAFVRPLYSPKDPRFQRDCRHRGTWYFEPILTIRATHRLAPESPSKTDHDGPISSFWADPVVTVVEVKLPHRPQVPCTVGIFSYQLENHSQHVLGLGNWSHLRRHHLY